MKGKTSIKILFFFDFIVLLKITVWKQRREDPKTFIKVFVKNILFGWGNILKSKFFKVILLMNFFKDNFLKYFGDNSVIFFKSSYWKKRLRPRCWIKITIWCSSWVGWTVRPLKFYMIWVQVGVSQTGFYLASFYKGNSTKGPFPFEILVLYLFANSFRTVKVITTLGVVDLTFRVIIIQSCKLWKITLRLGVLHNTFWLYRNFVIRIKIFYSIKIVLLQAFPIIM